MSPSDWNLFWFAIGVTGGALVWYLAVLIRDARKPATQRYDDTIDSTQWQ